MTNDERLKALIRRLKSALAGYYKELRITNQRRGLHYDRVEDTHLAQQQRKMSHKHKVPRVRHRRSDK